MVTAPTTSPFSSSHQIGSLASYPHYDATTHIGTHFPDSASTQLSQLLTSSDSDTLLKDLASLVSHRGVVFFSNQDITVEQQKELGERLGKLSGKPESSGLHKHPISEDVPELGADISIISSKEGITRVRAATTRNASIGWHADITFERVPSDYAILKIHSLPETGGDTLWASGYEAYDRLSPAYQKFLEGLTAFHDGGNFLRYAEKHGKTIQKLRGSPENITTDLTAVHPVIRTNPVTGWKTLFVNRGFTRRINELSYDESEDVLKYLFSHVADNHDFQVGSLSSPRVLLFQDVELDAFDQVRYKWNENDVAIWDNRATFHTATNDYGEEHRQGNRVVSIGEKPYYDPASKSRRDALGAAPGVIL
ncbi:hypothetical protein V5O48_016511 [Marasmius crinis-equi]|uniref:TauD/TfdA-like domain-containing protein n=1 Tax=Marasmius crinis-equi TaxID=585013 RepID=A0ABR3ERH8_9AGAR